MSQEEIASIAEGRSSDPLVDMDPDVSLLMTASDVGLCLGVTATRVCVLADTGKLPIAARTVRGWRLFRPVDVQRLRAERERAKVQ